MPTIISDECIYNILGTIQERWEPWGDQPTGSVLENIIATCAKPFYSDVRALGSTNTIVDVAIGNLAFDIKGLKIINHLYKCNGSTNQIKKQYTYQQLPDNSKVWVGVDRQHMAFVRRPNIDLEGYKGNPEKILNEQADEYQQFSIRTTSEAGCNYLYSLVLAYGEDLEKGFRSAAISIEPFCVPRATTYKVAFNSKTQKPNAYIGNDANGNEVLRLSAITENSSNFKKQYQLAHTILITWKVNKECHRLKTRDSISKTCSIAIN